MRRNEDYPSYYYKDIEGAAEIALERSAGEPFRELKVYGESVQGENLFDTGTANDYKAYSIASGVLEVNGDTLTAAGAGGFATYCIKQTNYIPGTYCVSAIFSGKPRFVINLYNDADELMDNTSVVISGWSYNKVYRGWYSSSNCVVNIPEGVAYWRIGVAFYSGTTGEKVSVSNIKLYKAPSPGNPIPVESVGERTRNLVRELIDGYVYSGDKFPVIYNDKTGIYKTIHIQGQKAGQYTFSFEKAVNIVRAVSQNHHDSNTSLSCVPQFNCTYCVVTTTEDEDFYISFRDTTNAEWGNSWVQCVAGAYTVDTIPDYEPYGYKVIVEVSSEDEAIISTIYLKEPLRKVGNYADELDVIGEKVTRNVAVLDDTGELSIGESLEGAETPVEESITLSEELKTLKRNCQLRVKTSLSPSKVKAQYYRY